MTLMPFLLFDGNCAQAMTFYQACLGGELTLTQVAQTPMKEQLPAEFHQKIAFAHLKNGFLEFSGTDWMHPTRKFQPGNTVCLYITNGTYSELKQLFDKLSVGADQELLDELRDLPFGSYGHLADQYGVHWFFQGEKQTKIDVG